MQDPTLAIFGVRDKQRLMIPVQVLPASQSQLILTQARKQQQLDVLTRIAILVSICRHEQTAYLPLIQIAGSLVILRQGFQIDQRVLLQIAHPHTPCQDRLEQRGDPIVGGRFALAHQTGLECLSLLQINLR